MVSAIKAFPKNKVLIATSAGVVALSTDNGENWSVIDTVSPGLDIQKIDFVDENDGWLISWDKLFKTTNGGYTWTSVDFGKPFLLLSLQFIDPSNGWIGGENGKIRRTSDGGATWVDQWSTTGARIEDIEFVSSQAGYAVGGGVYGSQWVDSSRVLTTSDAGETWTPLPHPHDRWITDIHLIGSEHGFIAAGEWIYSLCQNTSVSVEETKLATADCEKFYFDLLGRQVGNNDSGLLIEYDPCTSRGRVILRE
jgi:photosystem II stability/assembly factor-like uncharacterized protein